MKKILTLLLVIGCISTLFSCSFLGGEQTEHVLIKVEEIAPTCTSEGVGEHYKCSGCDLLFDDAEGKYKINAPKVIPVKHNLSLVPGTSAEVCQDGILEHYACADCGLVFKDADGKIKLDSIVDKGHHNPEIVLGKEATCTEEGTTAYRVCTDCGEVLTPPVVTPAVHKSSPSASLWGVTMETIDGRAYLVIYGGVSDYICTECGEAAPLKLAIDLEHNNNLDGKGWDSALVYADNNNYSAGVGDKTIVKPAVEAAIHDGLFEAYFDITDLEVGSTLTIHGGLDGKMADLKDQGSGDGVAAFADGKKFSFRLDSNTWKIASIVVSEAEENEFNLNGRVNLAEIDGKPYLVYQGAWNTKNSSKEAVESAINEELSSTFDIMELNTWAKPAFDYVLNVNDDGAITLALCLENLTASTNPYYMHRALGNSNSGGDVKLPTGHDYVIYVGGYRYVIVKGSSAVSWLKTFTVINVTEITE